MPCNALTAALKEFQEAAEQNNQQQRQLIEHFSLPANSENVTVISSQYEERSVTADRRLKGAKLWLHTLHWEEVTEVLKPNATFTRWEYVEVKVPRQRSLGSFHFPFKI